MMQPITKKVPIKYGGMSLIGTGRERPVSWGNYHSIFIDNKEYRVPNMWRENLEDAHDKFLTDNEVEVRIYSNFVLIDDERIPDNYYYDPLHMKYWNYNIDEARDAYEYWGDPNFEFEQFIDPKSYYEKRGWTYNNGIISKSI